MPKKVDRVERKNQIVAAAWRVILNKGIDKVSMQNIAEEANMSVGLIQHNFSSKDRVIHYSMKLIILVVIGVLIVRQLVLNTRKSEVI